MGSKAAAMAHAAISRMAFRRRQFRMVARGGEGCSGWMWPSDSLAIESTNSDWAAGSSAMSVDVMAMNGTMQAWLQTRAPSSSDGQPWQSPMSASPISMADISRDMLVAPTTFPTVPAANTASKKIANMRTSLRMLPVVAPFMLSVQIAVYLQNGAIDETAFRQPT